jgi:hypothetical protein
VPALIAAAGGKASEHFLGFFAATIRNKNTRAAYVQAVAQFFRWCEQYDLNLASIRPLQDSQLCLIAFAGHTNWDSSRRM